MKPSVGRIVALARTSGGLMDSFTQFVLGVAGGAALVLGGGYAAYKIWIRRNQ